jgi:hypothetical protein
MGAHDIDFDDSTQNADAEADLIPTFTISMRIVRFSKVSIMDAEHSLTYKE